MGDWGLLDMGIPAVGVRSFYRRTACRFRSLCRATICESRWIFLKCLAILPEMSMTLATPAQIDLETVEELLSAQTPQQIIQWAVAQFGDGLVMSSSFGAESAVLLHMATQYQPDIRV